jgi:hypothetical protein
MTTAGDIINEAKKAADPVPPTGAAPQGPEGWTGTGIALTPAQLRARRSRSIAIALALGAFVLVIFSVTIVKLGSNVFTGPSYMRPVQPPG